MRPVSPADSRRLTVGSNCSATGSALGLREASGWQEDIARPCVGKCCVYTTHSLMRVSVLCSFGEISCVAGAASLSELALDGNPIAHELSYKQTVLRHVTQIRQLDMKRVTVRARLACRRVLSVVKFEIFECLLLTALCLQSFDAVGWAAGRAFGL